MEEWELEEKPDLSGVEDEGEYVFHTPRRRLTFSPFNSPIAGPLLPGTHLLSPSPPNQLSSLHSTSLRSKIDQAVILFNKAPKAGFEYLLKERLCRDRERDLAYFMLVTMGLDKTLIGEVLGGGKKEELAILQAYADLLDFTSIAFDTSLRLFLSRFRLPGEAQKIDRIINTFSQRYYADNPSLFPNQDTPYVLAFSLIMLNTDHHSSKIPENRKMTKAQFIKNNREVLTTMSEQYLGEMYDRITAEQLETKTEGLEVVYKRLVAFSDTLKLNHLSPTKQKSLLVAAHQSSQLLHSGSLLIKYPRKGSPRSRYFFLSSDESQLLWRHSRDSPDRPRSINISAVVEILVGATNTENYRRYRIPMEMDNLCFSLVTRERSVDLRADSKEVMGVWVIYFREKVRENAERDRNNKRRDLTEDNIEAKWEEIVDRWQFHWDPDTQQPRRYQEPESAGCFLCRARREAGELRALTNNGHYLDMMWRRGIPNDKREFVWTAVLGMATNVSPSQYTQLCQEATALATSSDLSAQTKYESMQKRLEGAREEVEQLQFLRDKLGENWREVVERLMKVLFLHYSDVSLLPCLPQLLSVFLFVMPEHSALSCLLSLLTRYHFPSLLSSLTPQITAFDHLFAAELPALHTHFRSLIIDSKVFIREWYASLFSKALPIPIALHVWDVIFLEGETYIVKVAVGILKYWERELRTKSFEGIVSVLKRVPVTMDEEEFMEAVDSINMRT